jgi:hypothetical protein
MNTSTEQPNLLEMIARQQRLSTELSDLQAALTAAKAFAAQYQFKAPRKHWKHSEATKAKIRAALLARNGGGRVSWSTDQWKQHIQSRCIVDDNNCWVWQGPKNKPTLRHPSNGGYGLMNYIVDGKHKMCTTHRVAYQLWVGPIPAGREVLHSPCANKACCNPDHLYAGTKIQNWMDYRNAPNYKPGGNPNIGRYAGGSRGFKWWTSGVNELFLAPGVAAPETWKPGRLLKSQKGVRC